MKNLQFLQLLKTNWKIITVALGAYFFFLISSFPANTAISWFAPKQNNKIVLSTPSGTIWSGKLAMISINGIAIQNIKWNLHILPLLIGDISLDFSFRDKQSNGTGIVTVDMSGATELENLQLRMPISSFEPLMFGIPVKLGGQLSAHFDNLNFIPGKVLSAKGNLVWNSASVTTFQLVQLGDLKLKIKPVKKGSQAMIEDSDGPLIVDGTIQLSANGLYQVAIKVGTRSTADKLLKDGLSMLGRPGSDGKIPIHRNGRLPFM